MKDISLFCIYEHESVHRAILCINKNASGIALVVDDEGYLKGTITDGDIRRAILAGFDLSMSAIELVKQKNNPLYPEPITASIDTDRKKLLQLMQKHVIRQIPLLDENGKVAALVTINELMKDDTLPLQAVIMAGGFGTRLSPLTEELPKPMLPVGDRPLMERSIEQLRRAGIRHVNITTHYLHEKIIEHFGNGENWGVDIHYVTEERPLGTAGALGLLQSPEETLLVINGDILTQLDFKAMLNFHRKHQASLTVGVRQYDLEIPYGVMECDGPHIKRIREKPTHSVLVNAGVYLLEPSSFQYIPNGEMFNMTDLVQSLIDDKQTVVSFPIIEYWLDIGQHMDYEKAQEDIKNGRYTS